MNMQARGAVSSGTLLHLVIGRCLGASVVAERVVELLRAAEIFVLNMGHGVAECPPARPPRAARGPPTARTFCIRWLRGLSPLLLCSYVLFE